MDIDRTINEYTRVRQPTYRLFASRVQELLTSLLKSGGIECHSVTSREKDPSSFREKITREGKSYVDPFEDVTDLAGVRLITYFPKDVDKILPIIEKEFVVDRKNSVDKRKTADPSVFGYASVHLVVSMSQNRLRLAEYAVFSGLKCEIQVRTILQHAWAEIEHNIIYKSSQDIPFELRRKFASLAGLLEVADREFEVLRQDETRIRNQIRSTIGSKNIRIPVDMESLSFYLQNYHNEKEPKHEAVSSLVRILSDHHVDSIELLDAMLSGDALAWADREVKRIVFPCDSSKRCLLRYALAVGKCLGIKRESLGEDMHCAALAGDGAARPPSEAQRGSVGSAERVVQNASKKPNIAAIKSRDGPTTPVAQILRRQLEERAGHRGGDHVPVVPSERGNQATPRPR